MIDREGEIEIGDLEDGVEYVKTDDSSTSGDDSGLDQTIQNTQSELADALLSDGKTDVEMINTDTVEYSSDEYYESIEKQQLEADALKEELNDEDDSVIETGQDYDEDSDGYDEDDTY